MNSTEREISLKKKEFRAEDSPSSEIMLGLLDGSKDIMNLSSYELSLVPVGFLIQYTQPIELLEVWTKLPNSYKNCFDLQTSLPCFVHHNVSKTQVDGPPSSQRKCHLCIRKN